MRNWILFVFVGLIFWQCSPNRPAPELVTMPSIFNGEFEGVRHRWIYKISEDAGPIDTIYEEWPFIIQFENGRFSSAYEAFDMEAVCTGDVFLDKGRIWFRPDWDGFCHCAGVIIDFIYCPSHPVIGNYDHQLDPEQWLLIYSNSVVNNSDPEADYNTQVDTILLTRIE